MGIHKHNDRCNNATVTLQSEKITPNKGKPMTAKWSVSHPTKKHHAMSENNNKDSQQHALLPTPVPVLNRRSSLDAMILSALREPVQEFPLDAIPQILCLTAEQCSISIDLDPILSLTEDLHQTEVMEFPLESIPGVVGSGTSVLPGWTATWVE